MTRWLLVVLVSLIASVPVARAESAHDKAFAEKVQLAAGASLLPLLDLRIALSPETCALSQECAELKSFHKELSQELRSGSPNCRRTALKYLALFVRMVRWTVWEQSKRESRDDFEKALGEEAQGIRETLDRQLPILKGEDAVHAATCLLAFDRSHPNAAGVVLAALRARRAGLRVETCKLVGEARLIDERIVEALISSLDDEESEVREGALIAIWHLGASASKAAPKLIPLLSREESYCSLEWPFAMVSPFHPAENIALLALAEMGQLAEPALPALIRSLTAHDEKLRSGTVICLGQLGPVARTAVPALRRLLSDKKESIRLEVAVALLCIDPTDEKASDLLCSALKRKGEQRHQAVRTCAKLGPKAKSAVPALTAVLEDHSNTENRLKAAEALGKMGPIAAGSVPSLEKMLHSSSVPGGSTYEVPLYAADALASIGKEAIPVLIRHVRKRTDEKFIVGQMDAVKALGQLREPTEEVYQALLDTLDHEHLGIYAAIAIGKLKPDSAKVRTALAKADRKLSRIPRNERALEFRAALELREAIAWARMQLRK